MVVLSSPLLDETAVASVQWCSGGPVAAPVASAPSAPAPSAKSNKSSIFILVPRIWRAIAKSDRENEKQAWSLFTHGSRQQQAGLLRMGRKESTLKQQ